MVLSPACPAHGAAETVFADLQVGPFGHEWFRSRCSFEDSLRSGNASGGMNRVWARTAKIFSFFSDAHFVFLSTTWKCILESDTHRKEAMVPQNPHDQHLFAAPHHFGETFSSYIPPNLHVAPPNASILETRASRFDEREKKKNTKIGRSTNSQTLPTYLVRDLQRQRPAPPGFQVPPGIHDK